MRNRDAAVRSRERKKMYVKDLEMKSKYYEAECKRLGIVLQCCLAENQALRLSLHNTKAFDPSMTKQESAVLLLGKDYELGICIFFLFLVSTFLAYVYCSSNWYSPCYVIPCLPDINSWLPGHYMILSAN